MIFEGKGSLRFGRGFLVGGGLEGVNFLSVFYVCFIFNIFKRDGGNFEFIDGRSSRLVVVYSFIFRFRGERGWVLRFCWSVFGCFGFFFFIINVFRFMEILWEFFDGFNCYFFVVVLVAMY